MTLLSIMVSSLFSLSKNKWDKIEKERKTRVETKKMDYAANGGAVVVQWWWWWPIESDTELDAIYGRFYFTHCFFFFINFLTIFTEIGAICGNIT